MLILDAEIEIKAFINVYEYLHHVWLPQQLLLHHAIYQHGITRGKVSFFRINSLISLMFVDGSVSSEVYLFINIY